MEQKNKSNQDKKMIKITNSHYIIVPATYVNDFSLNKYLYKAEVSEDGMTIIYRRSKRDSNFPEKE